MKLFILLLFVFNAAIFSQNKKPYPVIIEASSDLQTKLDLSEEQTESVRKILADYQNNLFIKDKSLVNSNDTLSVTIEQKAKDDITSVLNNDQKREWINMEEWWNKAIQKIKNN